MKKLILVLFVVGLSFIQSPTTLAQTSSNLVLDMTFDNDTPTTVTDNSQYHNNGILHGATLGSNDCFSGSCYTFDGATNYIDIANTPSLNPTTITLSAWVKPIGKGEGNYLGVIGKSGSIWMYSIRQDGIVILYLIGVNNGNWVTSSEPKKNLFDGIWHHLVVTYDGANQKLYIDGVPISSKSATGSISSSADPAKVGEGFKGQMDNVRIYNRALTAQEVTQLYASYGEIRTNGDSRMYYVSSSTGNDNNDGLSQSTPWRTLEKIFKATAYPGKIIPGDSILLKRGDTWTGHIGLGSYKGDLNSLPITIGAYGTGPKPIIYGDGRGLTWTAVPSYSGVYETSLGIGSIPGSVYQGNTSYTYSQTPFSLAPGYWGHPRAILYGRRGLGNLETIWVHTLDGNPPHDMRVFLPAIVDVYKSENIIIENLDLRETTNAVFVSESDSIIIRDIDTLNTQDVSIYFDIDTNSIMDRYNAVNSGNTVFYIFEGSNNIIRNSSLYGVYNTISGVSTPGGDNAGIGLQESRGNLVEYNKLDGAGLDYFFENDSILRYNHFQNSPGSNEGGGGAFYPHGTNLTVYGNIVNFNSSVEAPGMNAGQTGDLPIKIFNNTFYLPKTYAMMSRPSGASTGNGPVIFRNNLVYVSGNTDLTSFSNIVDSDYNCYYTISTPTFLYADGEYHSLAAFQQATGQELHSVFADPKLTADLKLNSDSPCKDMGANLSSLINFPYKDYLGVTIPQGPAPDAGAFEFVSTSGDTTPPVISSVSASALTTSVATIAWTTDENSDTQVEYGLTVSYGNSTTLNTSLVTSHSATISGLTAGTLYHYRVKSRDAAGNLATSADYIFSTTPAPDTTSPTVSITAPASGTTVSGLTVAVSATASDNVGVAGVQFKLDGANLGAEDTSSPYGTTWNTTTASNTSHALSAVGRDAAGNSTTSTAVTVIVNNIVPATPPAITSLQPTSGPIGTSVTLTGTNFTPTGNRVKFGNLGSENNPNYSLNSTNGTTLVFPVPAGNYYACWVAIPPTPVCNVPAYSTSPGIYQVSIINSRGASNTMPFTVTTTPGTQTSTISNVQINSIKRSSAIVTWNTNIPTNGQVEYGLTTAYGQVTLLSSTLELSHNALVQNLVPNTNYFFRIKSKDISGNPAPHNGSTFKTLSRLEKPPQLTLLGAEKGSVILNWGSIDYDLCQSIKVYRSTTDFVATPVDSSLLTTLTCSEITYHDEAVTPSTKYYYSLFTVDDQGVFSDPAHISFTTEPRSTSGGRYTPPPSTPPTAICSLGQMFSPTTGARCTSFTQPVSCLSGQMFNPATGERCNTTISSSYVPPVAPGVSVYNFGPTTLKNGSRGEAVMELQRFLNKALNLALVVDGILGPKTTLFIKYWQTANGLLADGLVGAKTKAKMNAQ